MNHFLATYIDFVQSIAFISIFTIVILIFRKFLLDSKNDNYIEAVKIKVDK